MPRQDGAVNNPNGTWNRRSCRPRSLVRLLLDAPHTAYVGHQLGNRTLTLELCQESDGFRRFSAHLLALYQAPALRPNRDF
jgi:hypothetical protein